jgi:hypothetical protein
MILPPEAHPLVQALALHFTSPTDQRFSTLHVGAVLTTGRRTVANLVRALRQLAPGHPADYRRVLSRAPWSGSPSAARSPASSSTASSRPGRCRWSATTPWTASELAFVGEVVPKVLREALHSIVLPFVEPKR